MERLRRQVKAIAPCEECRAQDGLWALAEAGPRRCECHRGRMLALIDRVAGRRRDAEEIYEQFSCR